MRDLSLKGVARHFLGISGDFEVVGPLFGVSAVSGTESLRARLESIARRNYSFEKSECIYGWTAAFEQVWSHVIVRIRLLPAFNLPLQNNDRCAEATLAKLDPRRVEQ